MTIHPPGNKDAQAVLLGHLQWSCDRLGGLLDRERERRQNLESKATQAFAATAGAAGLAFESLRGEHIPSLWYVVPTLIVVLLALIAALSALLVRTVSGESAEAHFDDDGTTASGDVLSRTNRVRHNLGEAVREVHATGERKALWVFWAQVLAAASVILLVGAVVWSLLFGA